MEGSCIEFVEELVEKFEGKLEDYRNERDGRKELKNNQLFKELGKFEFIKCIFNPRREKVTTVLKVLYEYKRGERKAELRRILVEAGVNIFYNYHNCLMKKVEEKGPYKIESFAKNAVKRIMEYIYMEKYLFDDNLEINRDILTRSIVYNNNARLGELFGNYDGFGTINKSAGVINIKGEIEFLYKNRKSSSSYQCRYLFAWEDLEDFWKYQLCEKKPHVPFDFKSTEENILAKFADSSYSQEVKIRKHGERPPTRQSIAVNLEDCSDQFIGRETELDNIHAFLSKQTISRGNLAASTIVLIAGLGGIGKSSLAKMYFYKYIDYYDNNMVWLHAETQMSLTYSFHDLAKLLQVRIKNTRGEGDEKEDRPIKHILQEVYEKLTTTVLIVFDNAAELGDIEAFLPYNFIVPQKCIKPSILITSRCSDWKCDNQKIHPIPLEEFSKEDALYFVRNKLPAETEEDILELCRKLRYFPLALKDAVAYILEECESREDFGEEPYGILPYLQEKKNLSPQNKIEETEKLKVLRNVSETWNITIKKIKETNTETSKLAIQIMEIIAYLSPDHINYKACFQQSFLKIKDEQLLKNALKLLRRYSLIQLNEGMVCVHRLVQKVTRLRLKETSNEVLQDCVETVVCDENHNGWYGKVDVNNKMFVFRYACKHDDVVNHFKTRRSYDLTGKTLRLLAEGKYNESHVKTLLRLLKKEEVDVNARSAYGENALVIAASRGRHRCVEILLKHGADQTNLALQRASQRYHTATVEILEKHIAEQRLHAQ